MSMKRIATTAERLQEAMAAAKKKQIDLVRETGLEKGAVSRYVSGQYEPKQEAIYKLAVTLNVSEMWLWGYDVPKSRSIDQKKNDQLAKLVVKMRSDSEFFDTVAALAELSEKQYQSVKQLIAAFKE